MPYERNDLNNDPAGTQPASNSITLFGGSEGWTTIIHEDWNGDYSKRDITNGTVVPGTYSKRNIDNEVVIPAAYQRRDTDNNPVSL
jgi:hypothetical protein